MKRMKWLNCILGVLLVGMVTVAFAGTEDVFDVTTYDKIAKRNIGRVISGNIDADKMITDMEKLLELGVAGCEEHMRGDGTPAREAKIMRITIDNARRMTSLTLDEIEEQWHEGGALKASGIDIDINSMDHFSKLLSYYDAVVHPATAIICLKEYKKTRKVDLLEQMKAELEEVREHVQHLD